jgi:DNA-binding transcriptional regulator YiaG
MKNQSVIEQIGRILTFMPLDEFARTIGFSERTISSWFSTKQVSKKASDAIGEKCQDILDSPHCQKGELTFEQIEFLRISRKLTIGEFTEKLGIALNTYYNLRDKRTLPSIKLAIFDYCESQYGTRNIAELMSGSTVAEADQDGLSTIEKIEHMRAHCPEEKKSKFRGSLESVSNESYCRWKSGKGVPKPNMQRKALLCACETFVEFSNEL